MSALDDAGDFLAAVSGFASAPKSGQVPSSDKAVRIAVIDPAYTGTGLPKVTFEGETVMSTKGYPYIGVVPGAGARVIMLPTGRSYVILGGIGGMSAPAPNLVLNAEFRVNQRKYVSATALALAAYGFDCWRATTVNTSLTFVAGAQGQAVTISSGGSIAQTIERANVRPGTYTLAWGGTATGRVYNAGAGAPAYAASPVTVTLDGTADVVIEFAAVAATKTLSAVQLVAGIAAGPVEHLGYGDELRRCQRFYHRIDSLDNPFGNAGMGFYVTTTQAVFPIPHPVTMRVAPSFTSSAASTWNNASAISQDVPGKDVSRLSLTVAGTAGQGSNLQANNTTAAFIAFSADF